MIQYDDQQYLINKEASRIKQQDKKVNKNPYLISSFNKQFDYCLKQLVTDYEFDFDKIALHLYYLFPVYEQKITSRTVAVRWWQLQMQYKINNNNKEQQNLEVENNNEYENIIRNNMQSICDQRFQLKVDIKSSFRTQEQKSKRYQNKNRDNILSLTQYKHALQKSLILQQQQQQRPILYKPKFIIDSQYKLQRYELFDSNYFDNINQKHLSNNINNNYSNDEDEQYNQQQNNDYQNDGNELVNLINHQNYHQNIGIQQILSKVVNNEFVYDQFGGFGVSVGNQYKQQLQNKKRQQWWQKQLSIDSQDQFSQQQSQQQSESLLLQQNKIQYHQQQLSQQQHHQLPIVFNNNYIQQQQQQQSLHSILCSNINNQIYQIDDNWDQYQSD